MEDTLINFIFEAIALVDKIYCSIADRLLFKLPASHLPDLAFFFLPFLGQCLTDEMFDRQTDRIRQCPQNWGCADSRLLCDSLMISVRFD